jgi:hypothetical protein
LLTWHGVSGSVGVISQRVPIHSATTCYRFCEVGKARKSIELFLGGCLDWSNDFDQWQYNIPADLRDETIHNFAR